MSKGCRLDYGIPTRRSDELRVDTTPATQVIFTLVDKYGRDDIAKPVRMDKEQVVALIEQLQGWMEGKYKIKEKV